MTTTPELDRKLNGGENPKPASSGEEDPCIQEIDKKSHKRNFRERTEEKLRERSGLSQRGLHIAGLVLLLLLILLITVIALGAAWPRTPHHRQYPVCEEAACLQAAAQVKYSQIIFYYRPSTTLLYKILITILIFFKQVYSF